MKIMLIILMTVLTAAAAGANDAALNEGAFGPEPVGWYPGNESAVQMTAEEIQLEVGFCQTRVTARFHFLNRRDTAVQQLIGFPDHGATAEEMSRQGIYGQLPEVIGPLRDLTTLVDGLPATSARRVGYIAIPEGELLYCILDPDGFGTWSPATPSTGIPMVWHAISVDFPPGREVVVERSYTVDYGIFAGRMRFSYTTATGSSWYGTIGSLAVDAELVGGLLVSDLDPDELARQGWQVRSPTRLTMDWRDFEPRDDIYCRGFSLTTVFFDDDTETLLAAARCGDCWQAESVLVDGRVLPDATDAAGWTPLHLAVDRDHPKLVRLLLAAGAAVDARTPRGRTPLMLAVLANRFDLVALLLEAGADPSTRDADGLDVFGLAARYERTAMAGFLSDKYRLGLDSECPELVPLELLAPSPSGIGYPQPAVRHTAIAESGLACTRGTGIAFTNGTLGSGGGQ